jgi:thiamine biosynthesis lipoprotein
VSEVRRQGVELLPKQLVARVTRRGVARLFLLAAVTVLLGSCRSPDTAGVSRGEAVARSAREIRVLMGTTAEVKVGGLADPTAALDAAFAALARVDEQMSLWKESELAALNRTGHGVVSAETFAVVRHALGVAAASGGAFDPTVEPLVRAAGGLGEPARSLDPEQRRALLARVGYQNVRLDDSTRTVHLAAGARLVLDGLAKGHAADRALRALREAGATSGLVDLGGSTLAVFGEPLTIDLNDPTGEGRPWGAFRVVTAVGTSGGDQRPGHILDPRTGEPPRGVLQATVVAPSALEADALSTAVMVLGAEDGLALVHQRDAAGLVLLLENGHRLVRTTPGFSAAHGLVAAPGVEVR